MSEPVEHRVRQTAADIFNIPLAQVTNESSPSTVDSWDSVQHLNFVLALEQELGISIEPEEIEQVQSIGAAIELARRKTGQ